MGESHKPNKKTIKAVKILLNPLTVATIIITLTIIITQYNAIQIHEEIHKEIMETYGCTDAIIEIKLFSEKKPISGQTTCFKYAQNRTETDQNNEMLLHRMLHVQHPVTFQNTYLLFLILFVVVLDLYYNLGRR